MTDDELLNRVDQVTAREALVDFLGGLKTNLKTERSTWENPDLPRFLDAMGRWIEDAGGTVAVDGRESPSEETNRWTLFAHMLLVAKVYE